MISLVVVLIACGLLCTAIWYLPIPQPFRGFAMAAVCLLAAVWLLAGVGIGDGWRLRP